MIVAFMILGLLALAIFTGLCIWFLAMSFRIVTPARRPVIEYRNEFWPNIRSYR